MRKAVLLYCPYVIPFLPLFPAFVSYVVILVLSVESVFLFLLADFGLIAFGRVRGNAYFMLY